MVKKDTQQMSMENSNVTETIEQSVGVSSTATQIETTTLETTVNVTTVNVQDETDVHTGTEIVVASDTVTSAVSANSIEIDEETTQLLTTYTNVLMQLLSEQPEYYTVTAFDVPAMMWSTDVGFMDINADKNPELIVGCGHGINGIDTQSLYATDGTSIGDFPVNWDGAVYVDDTWYATAVATGYEIYTQLIDGLPYVYLDWRDSNAETFGEVHVKEAGKEVTELGEKTYAEASKVVEDYLGVTKEALSEAQIKPTAVQYICDTLRVQDPENYTQEDIYNSLLELYVLYCST